MLYLGIDLHRKQITVALRDEQGEFLMRRQVSTHPAKIDAFLHQLRDLADGKGYTALLEVCGFHDWIVERLRLETDCQEVILIQPEKTSKKKTDRRDAAMLSEMLWLNRQRLLEGKRVKGVRQVLFPDQDARRDRQLTTVRQFLTEGRTRTLNRIHFVLRKNNLEWDYPTKTFQTQKGRAWLATVELDEIDRLEMDQLLEQWGQWDRQLEQVDAWIEARFQKHEDAKLLASIVGVSCYMALAIASRIGDISRFPSARSLANFFGLTPGSRSSGDKECSTSITKQGSRTVRFLLGQLVVHVLRRDGRMRAWYKRIKKRRGSKIARVAVMRRLCVIMWHMLQKRETYRYEATSTTAGRDVDDPEMACATDMSENKAAFLAGFVEADSGQAVAACS